MEDGTGWTDHLQRRLQRLRWQAMNWLFWKIGWAIWRKRLGLRTDYLFHPIWAYRWDQQMGIGFSPRVKTAERRAEALRQREEEKSGLQ